MVRENEIPQPVFISAPKAATLCGVSRNTVCCWIRDGKLPSYRTAGGKNLIRPGDLLEFMKENSLFVPQSLADMAAQDDRAMGSGGRAVTPGIEPSVLVVDDDPGARSVAVRCLKEMKLPVLEAETGYEALHILVQHPEVALIVLDLIMPGQHGAETFVQIRRQHKGIPVIVVTGFPSERSDPIFGELEPDAILAKPYDPGDLMAIARSCLADALA